jgi:4'-phosphopantetheinyl transferase
MTRAPGLDATPDRVDLWLVLPGIVPPGEELVARYRALLSEREKAQELSFHFARDRHRFLLTRALVRTVLSRYAPVCASEWRFEPDAHGRPVIVNDPPARTISFNISHTEGMIALAVTSDRAIGVDVELMTRDISLGLAEFCCSAAELSALQTLPAAQRRRRLLTLWTLKESYVKARGLGLALPLHKCSFDLENCGGRAVHFDQLNDVPERWSFYQVCVSESHALALCVEHTAAERHTINVRQLVPLLSEKTRDCAILRLGG